MGNGWNQGVQARGSEDTDNFGQLRLICNE